MSTVKEVVGYAKNIEEGEAEELGDVEKLFPCIWNESVKFSPWRERGF